MTLLFCLHCINHSSALEEEISYFFCLSLHPPSSPFFGGSTCFSLYYSRRDFFTFTYRYIKRARVFISRFVKNVYFYHIADVAGELCAFKTYFVGLVLVYIYNNYI